MREQRRVTGGWSPNQNKMVNQNGGQKSLKPNQGVQPNRGGAPSIKPPPPPPSRGSDKGK